MPNPFESIKQTVKPKSSFRRVEGAGMGDAPPEAGAIDKSSLSMELGAGWDKALKQAYEEAGIPTEETEEAKSLKALASVLGEEELKELLAKAGANPDVLGPNGTPVAAVDERPLSEVVGELVEKDTSDDVPDPAVELGKRKAQLQEEISGIQEELFSLEGVVYKASVQEEARKRSVQIRRDKLSSLETVLADLLTKSAEVAVDPEQLQKGIAIEMEHTDDAAVAEQIALDHLAELPDYYTKLQEMEGAEKEAQGEEITLEDLEGLEEPDPSLDVEEPLPAEDPLLESPVPEEVPIPPMEPLEGRVEEGKVEVPIEEVVEATGQTMCPHCDQPAGMTMNEEGRLQLSCPICDWEEPVSAEVVIQVGSGELPAAGPEITNDEGLAVEEGQTFYQPGPAGLPEEGIEEKQSMKKVKKAAAPLDGKTQGVKEDTLPQGTGEEPMAPNKPRPSDKTKYTRKPANPGKGSLPEASDGKETQPMEKHRDANVSTSPPGGGSGGIKGGPQDSGSLANPPGGPESGAGSFPGGLADASGSPISYEVKLAEAEDPVWSLTAGEKVLFQVKASEAYGPQLNTPYTDARGQEDPQGRTHLEVFKSASYGQALSKLAAAGEWDKLKGVGGSFTKKADPFKRFEELALGDRWEAGQVPYKVQEIVSEDTVQVDAGGDMKTVSRAEYEASVAEGAFEEFSSSPCVEGGESGGVDEDLLGMQASVAEKQAAPFMQPYAEDMENPAPEVQPDETVPEDILEEGDEGGEMNPPDELDELMAEEEEEKMLITDILIDTIAPMIVSDAYTINEIVDELTETFSDEELASEFSGALEEKVDNLKEEIGDEGEEAEEDVTEELEALPDELAAEEPVDKLTATPSVMEGEAAAEVKVLREQLKRAKLEKQAAEEDADLRFKVRTAHDLVRKLQERGRLRTVAQFEHTGMDHEAAVTAEQELVKSEIERIVSLAGKDFDQLAEFVNDITEPLEDEEEEVLEKEEKVASDQGLKTALASVGHQPIAEPTPPPKREGKSGVLELLDEGIWSRSKGVQALKDREQS